MNPAELTKSLKAEAQRLGFGLSGACQAISPSGFHHFSEWLADGYAGEMLYLSERKDCYEHPDSVMEGVESLLMLGMNYSTVEPNSTSSTTGRISRYAWGAGDYHDLIHTRLKSLCRFARELNEAYSVRGIIDTAPLLEREFASLSGLGWQAKNTMLINRQQGSWFFLAALLINQPLDYDQPIQTNHCGSCRACIDACPTDAFVKPHVLDATKCISYLTIEHRSHIPHELRSGIGDWILGCDICQEVCPWNRFSQQSSEPSFFPLDEHDPIELTELFDLDEDQFRKRFRKTPLWRPKRRGILRNAAIALGNHGDLKALPTLVKALDDEEPLVRGAAVWAIHQIDLKNKSSIGRLELEQREPTEQDEYVRKELHLAMHGAS